MLTLTNCAAEALLLSFFKSTGEGIQNLSKGLKKCMHSSEYLEKHSSLLLLSSLCSNLTLRHRLSHSTSLVESLIGAMCQEGMLKGFQCF